MSVDVALVVHGGREAARALATRTEATLRANKLTVSRTELAWSPDGTLHDHLEAVVAQLIVSLGGDGTFLRAARRAHELDVPVLGVNFGRVGYLLDVPPEELDQVIMATLRGDVPVEERAGLSLELLTDGAPPVALFAINELSIEKTVPGHVVRVGTEIDGEDFLTFGADGVLVATPTGSTAYNLSAGGPVLSPLLDGFVMTPVAPHFVLDRSVVLGGDQVVTLTVSGERPAVCVVDGISVQTLAPGDSVRCTRGTRWLKVVVLTKRGLGGRLRESLRQGHE
jgi:NAD+ kinase